MIHMNNIPEVKEKQDVIRQMNTTGLSEERTKELEDKLGRLEEIIKEKQKEFLSKSSEELQEINKEMEAKKMSGEIKDKSLIRDKVDNLEETGYKALKELTPDIKVLVSLTGRLLNRLRKEKQGEKDDKN